MAKTLLTIITFILSLLDEKKVVDFAFTLLYKLASKTETKADDKLIAELENYRTRFEQMLTKAKG